MSDNIDPHVGAKLYPKEVDENDYNADTKEDPSTLNKLENDEDLSNIIPTPHPLIRLLIMSSMLEQKITLRMTVIEV